MRFNTPFYVIACVAAISSWLLFHFQSDIVTLVSSSDLCDSEYYHIVQWGFPKIIFRCNLLREVGIQNYPSMGIMIILDFWIAFCCILSLIFCILKLQSIDKEDLFQHLAILREKERSGLAKASARFRVHSSIRFRIRAEVYGHITVSILFLGFVFVYSPAINDTGRVAFISLLASYGTGVLAHGIGSVIPSYCLFSSILSFRLLRAFLQGDIK